MRERLFTMRLSAEEFKRMEQISKHYGLNAASLFRMLLKREQDALEQPKAVSKPSKRRKP